MNKDGKMDKREFSIAMHLIAKKLQGFEVPHALPPGMTQQGMPGAMGSPARVPMMTSQPMLPPQMTTGAPMGEPSTIFCRCLINLCIRNCIHCILFREFYFVNIVEHYFLFGKSSICSHYFSY